MSRADDACYGTARLGCWRSRYLLDFADDVKRWPKTEAGYSKAWVDSGRGGVFASFQFC